jgi:hypothetical protein
MTTLLVLLAWCVLFVLCWPLALLALLLWPIVWLLSLLLRAILFLPARLLGLRR